MIVQAKRHFTIRGMYMETRECPRVLVIEC